MMLVATLQNFAAVTCRCTQVATALGITGTRPTRYQKAPTIIARLKPVTDSILQMTA